MPALDIICTLQAASAGTIKLWATMPPGVPGQTEQYLQFWIPDASGPEGVTASNALRAVFP